MKTHRLVGEIPTVQVHTKAEASLEQKARDLLLGKKVTGVFLMKDQLVIHMEDGGTFAMNCSGGFNEVN